MNKDDYRYVRWQAETANAAYWRHRLNILSDDKAFDELRAMYRKLAEEREAWGLDYWTQLINDGGKDA